MDCRYFKALRDHEYCRAKTYMSEGNHAYKPSKIYIYINPKEQNKNNNCSLYKRRLPMERFIRNAFSVNY